MGKKTSNRIKLLDFFAEWPDLSPNLWICRICQNTRTGVKYVDPSLNWNLSNSVRKREYVLDKLTRGKKFLIILTNGSVKTLKTCGSAAEVDLSKRWNGNICWKMWLHDGKVNVFINRRPDLLKVCTRRNNIDVCPTHNAVGELPDPGFPTCGPPKGPLCVVQKWHWTY